MPPSRDTDAGRIRIGELSRRVGVSVELLRAWERRYQLLSPTRTAGGLRLYDEEDERRVIRMREHLAAGVSAAEAAQLTARERGPGPPPEGGAPPVGAIGDQLRRALDRLDEAGANTEIDRLLSGFALDTVVREAVLPYLRELGERWQRTGDAVITEEHFASALLRGRLLGLARGWGGGFGPMALLACFPGDQHDLGLICFGLALRGNGWRITFLGPDTPLATVTSAARRLRPALVVLTATVRPSGEDLDDLLAAMAAGTPLALAGGGVSENDATAAGARFLAGDPFTAAASISAEESASGAHPAPREPDPRSADPQPVTIPSP